MKKIIPLLLVVLLIPQVTSAAWWDPLSWFNTPDIDQEREELLQRLVELEQRVDSQETASTTSLNIPDKVKEKIITQTIKVDNPELQVKIDYLVRENENLKSKVNTYISSLNQCLDTKSSSVSQTIQIISASDQIKEQKLIEIDNKILPVLKNFLAQADGYGNLASIPDFKALDSVSVNQLLQSYRVVDSKMTHLNVVITNQYGQKLDRDEQFQIATSLLNYLQAVYIPYR